MTEPDALAVGVMTAYCGWNPLVVATDVTVTLDGNGTRVLTLPSLRVTDVSAVTVTDRYGTDTAAVLDAGGDVGWSENGVLTWRSWGCWPEGNRNVSVTYSGGYSNPPLELTQVLLSIGKRTANLGTLGATSRKMGTAAVTYGAEVGSGDLLMVERMILDRYRLPGVA